MHNNIHKPTLDELPSSKDLLRSTKIALIGAIVILVTIVLPAEYAVDPTGIGGLLGLKKMGEIKQSLAKEAEAQDTKNASINSSEPPMSQLVPQNPNPSDTTGVINQNTSPETKKETMTAVIKPNGTAGLKAKISKGDTITYIWKASGWALNYDAHGEWGLRDFAQYEKWVGETSYEGTITADFDGAHGIFWRNRWNQDVTVIFEVSGEFEKLIRE